MPRREVRFRLTFTTVTRIRLRLQHSQRIISLWKFGRNLTARAVASLPIMDNPAVLVGASRKVATMSTPGLDCGMDWVTLLRYSLGPLRSHSINGLTWR